MKAAHNHHIQLTAKPVTSFAKEPAKQAPCSAAADVSR